MDVPDTRAALVDHQNFARALNDIHRVQRAHHEKARHPTGPAARVGLVGPFPGQSERILLRHRFVYPGLQDRVVQVRNANRMRTGGVILVGHHRTRTGPRDRLKRVVHFRPRQIGVAELRNGFLPGRSCICRNEAQREQTQGNRYFPRGELHITTCRDLRLAPDIRRSRAGKQVTPTGNPAASAATGDHGHERLCCARMIAAVVAHRMKNAARQLKSDPHQGSGFEG